MRRRRSRNSNQDWPDKGCSRCRGSACKKDAPSLAEREGQLEQNGKLPRDKRQRQPRAESAACLTRSQALSFPGHNEEKEAGRDIGGLLLSLWTDPACAETGLSVRRGPGALSSSRDVKCGPRGGARHELRAEV